MKIKGRIQLRKSAKNKLLDNLRSMYGDTLVEKIASCKFEQAHADDMSLILIDGKVLFFEVEDIYFPTLKGVIELGFKNKAVVVDSGAVRFVVNGADIMSPGIVHADENILEGDPVIVKEEKYGKPLAIGKALVPGTAMISDSGKAVKSLHHVGDHLWNLEV
ncbi:MAG: RNA-binding protein [Methanomethylovorans sp.]|nr:RNA-binding protein [Methanomethylovorans sp.]